VPYIELTQGKKALVDAKIFKILSIYQWYAGFQGKDWYAKRDVRQNGKRIVHRMHRIILELMPGDGRYVDHINHDTLDNRRCNLRICTHSQNHMNRQNGWGSSRFKGVSWFKQKMKWRAYIQLNGKMRHLGLFESETDAAKTYNKAAIRYYREFACLNNL
jgi:hypothetical protein